MGKGGRDEGPAGGEKDVWDEGVCVCAREGMSVSFIVTVLYICGVTGRTIGLCADSRSYL